MLLPAARVPDSFADQIKQMKAAVIYNRGERPRYEEVDEPVVQNSEETILTVKAAAIKHIDRSVAAGKHYAAQDKGHLRVIGGDGVGLLPDGKRVFAVGLSGTVAEKAAVEKARTVPVPDGLDDGTAAALPNAVAGSAMALRYRAAMQKGDTVLINGATGFTGRMAVQVAKHYGAKKIIVTGRNERSLQDLLRLGADETVSLKQSSENFTAQLKAIYQSTPVDVIIDYLWGPSAELVLASLKGKGGFTHKTRFVSVGAVTGDTIQLSAENLRSVDLHLTGSGLGSWTKEQVQSLFTEILPEMFALAAEGKLVVETVNVKLKDIETVWEMEVPDGKRVVVII